MAGNPDIRTSIISQEEFERNCANYADWAFFTPPEKFLFHHYDEPADKPLICHRPMVGIEKYVVSDMAGGWYGNYDTRDVTMLLKTETWIQLPDGDFFIKNEIARLERLLAEERAKLSKEQND